MGAARRLKALEKAHMILERRNGLQHERVLENADSGLTRRVAFGYKLTNFFTIRHYRH